MWVHIAIGNNYPSDPIVNFWGSHHHLHHGGRVGFVYCFFASQGTWNTYFISLGTVQPRSTKTLRCWTCEALHCGMFGAWSQWIDWTSSEVTYDWLPQTFHSWFLQRLAMNLNHCWTSQQDWQWRKHQWLRSPGYKISSKWLYTGERWSYTFFCPEGCDILA